MSIYEDVLFNESLAFCLSTNTFTNPLFNSLEADELSQYEQPDPWASRQRPQQPSQPPDKEPTEASSGTFKSLCDNLVFSVRSKIYVWELNFKRRVKSLRRLTRAHLPECLQANSRQRGFMSTNGIATGSFTSDSGPEQAPITRLPFEDSSLFWKKNAPNSKRSLDKQKQKLLCRLEQVVEAKRSSQLLFGVEGGQTSAVGANQANNSNSSSNSSSNPKLHRHRSSGLDAEEDPQLMSLYAHSTSDGSWGSSGIFAGSSGSSSSSSSGAGAGDEPTASKRIMARSKAKNNWSGRKARWMGSSGRQTSESGAINSKKLCIVCYTNAPNIVTIPCNHHEICSDCFIEIIYMAVKSSQYPLKCVLCRQKIEKIRCSRKLLLSVIKKNRSRP